MRTSEGRRESLTYRAVMYAVLITGAVPVLLPFYWMLVASLKTKERVEAYPPDWLPVVPRSFVAVGGAEQQVKIIDDGRNSGTDVCRVKVIHEKAELPRLPAGQIGVAHAEEWSARIGGLHRRVALRDGAADAASDAVEVALLGSLREETLPADAVVAEPETRMFWAVLGLELRVAAPAGDPPAGGDVRVTWESPSELIAVAPRVFDAETRQVAWHARKVPAELVSSDTGGGYWTVRLVCPPDGLDVPVGELRQESRTRFFAVVRSSTSHLPRRREVRPLAQDQQQGTVRVEILDEPQTVRVPRTQLERVPADVYGARLLGQDVVVEPVVTPLPDDPAAPVALRVPGPLSVVAGHIRSERPVQPQWANFKLAWREQTFDLYLVNTLFIAALVVLGTVLSCGLVGYAFARLEFRGRDFLFLLLLSTMMIPGQVTSIPTFVMFVKFGWIDSYKPLIVPSLLAGSAFFIFLYRQFMLTIPTDLEDSARIDGCGPLSTWWLIMMPLSKPIIVTVAVFTFIGVWNDFLGPLLYINTDEKQTVALGLQNFKSAFQYDDPQLLMAASVMMLLPSLVLFFIAQKAFIRGVVISGVKG
jgi:multiple sugar transport system permease protein/sn-glycerol 3-phosphate transport system permease protein